MPPTGVRRSRKRPTHLGTTFSQLQCRYMGLDYQTVFRQVCDLGLNRIRLCSYWNELEPAERQLNFTVLDWLLEESDRRGVEVVLTVGMKAPRWPEFHFPDWLSARHDTKGSPQPIDHQGAIADHTLRLLESVVTHARQAPALKYWQVENEPFTRLDITAGRFLSADFVRQEVTLVRRLALPGQKLLLTNALTLPNAELAEDEEAFQVSLALADAIGLNVYTKVPIGNSPAYLHPQPAYWQKLETWQRQMAAKHCEAWVAEAQAEPWEPNQLVAMSAADYPSASPLQAETLVTQLAAIGYSTVMLWGCEYWYWHKMNGRNLWWWTIQQLVEA